MGSSSIPAPSLPVQALGEHIGVPPPTGVRHECWLPSGQLYAPSASATHITCWIGQSHSSSAMIVQFATSPGSPATSASTRSTAQTGKRLRLRWRDMPREQQAGQAERKQLCALPPGKEAPDHRILPRADHVGPTEADGLHHDDGFGKIVERSRRPRRFPARTHRADIAAACRRAGMVEGVPPDRRILFLVPTTPSRVVALLRAGARGLADRLAGRNRAAIGQREGP